MKSIPKAEKESRIIKYKKAVAHWIYLYVTDAKTVALPKTKDEERDMTIEELQDSGCYIINADGIKNKQFFGPLREKLFWLRGLRDEL